MPTSGTLGCVKYVPSNLMNKRSLHTHLFDASTSVSEHMFYTLRLVQMVVGIFHNLILQPPPYKIEFHLELALNQLPTTQKKVITPEDVGYDGEMNIQCFIYKVKFGILKRSFLGWTSVCCNHDAIRYHVLIVYELAFRLSYRGTSRERFERNLQRYACVTSSYFAWWPKRRQSKNTESWWRLFGYFYN